MFNFIIKFLASGRSYLKFPLAGLILLIGIGASEAKPLPSEKLNHSVMPSLVARAEATAKDSANFLKGKLPEADGVYLYGQSPEPQQLGQEYMVFEMRQRNVIGAFYLPRSEFNCFQGTLVSGKLALKVADSPDSSVYADPTGATNSPKIAAVIETPHLGERYGSIVSPHAVALQNYYQLATVSEGDRQILTTCKNNY